jgi:hypothetical protein
MAVGATLGPCTNDLFNASARAHRRRPIIGRRFNSKRPQW